MEFFRGVCSCVGHHVAWYLKSGCRMLSCQDILGYLWLEIQSITLISKKTKQNKTVSNSNWNILWHYIIILRVKVPQNPHNPHQGETIAAIRPKAWRFYKHLKPIRCSWNLNPHWAPFQMVTTNTLNLFNGNMLHAT